MSSSEPPIAPVPMRVAMNRHPLTVSPKTAIQEAISLMSQVEQKSSCVLIVEESNLTGIFTERDLVRLIAAGTLREGATIDEVMTREPIALREDRAQDFLTILNIMGQHRIRHLPIVDGRGQLVGLIEHNSLRQALQPSDLMQLRRVEEVMNSQVVCASPQTPLLQLVQLMAEKSVSCVVITTTDSNGTPLGIITERDILQYQNLGLDFRHTPFDALGMHGKNPSGIAQTVMSTPLLPISGQDSLWVAHQQMQQYQVRRLVVCDAIGNLVGIITQTSILQAIDPAAIYRGVQVLQKQVERERILSSISLKISQSIDLAEILQSTATEVRQLLQVDRVLIYRFHPDWSGFVAIEALSDDRWSIHGREVSVDPCFPAAKIDLYRQGYPIHVIEDISRSELDPCYLELMEQLQIRANLVLPILLNIPVEKTESEIPNNLWGLLVAQECTAPRKWQQSEIDLLGQLVTKVAIAIQKATLFQQVQTELAERQQAEALLRKSEERFRRLTENAKDVIYRYRLVPSQATEYINPAIADLTGYSAGEFYADPELLFEIVYPEDREKFQQHFYNYREIHSPIVIRWMHRNGKVIWIEQRHTPIYDGELIAVEGIARDISSRLGKSDSRNSKGQGDIQSSIPKFLSQIRIPFWISGLVTASIVIGVEAIRPAGGVLPLSCLLLMSSVVLAANWSGLGAGLLSAAVMSAYVAYAAFMSFGPATLTGGPLQASLGILATFGVAALIGQTKERNKALTKVLHGTMAELETLVEKRTAALATANTLLRQEITDRQEAEEALVQSERRFRAIFNQTFQFTWLLTPEGRVMEANQTALDFGGLELADILGKPFWSAGWWRNSPESQIRLREAIARAASGEFVRYEVNVLGADDRIATIDFSLKPVQDETGQVVLLIPEGRDITERKQAEAALTKAKAELEIKVAQRTAALSEELTERRQAEAALRESEARFRTMADSAPVLLWVSGTDALCTFFNQPWLDFTGRTLEQELGNGWTENVHPEDFHYCLDIYLSSFHARKPFQMEYRLRRADGEYRWLLDRAIPRSNADGSFAGYIGSCIDITDRKLAEAERAKLIAIIEATPDFISSSSVDGKVLYFNKAARKILGLGEHEEIDNFHIPTGHPDWANDIIQTEGIPTAMGDGSWLGETALLSSDGREVPLSQLIIAHQGTDGKVNILSTIARDISKQKQIEATLRESERRWRSLLEHVRLVVVGLDRAGKVEYVNPFFLELVGYTKAEVLGSDWFATFLPTRDRPQVNKYFWEILERDFQPHYQNTILTKSGEERMIAWNNTRLQDAGGKAIGTMSIGEDITERYALERMKDEFISVVSHELRTPLTAIHGGLDLLSSGLVEPQSDRGKRILEIAAANSDRLVQLVNDILELERLHSGKIKLSKQQVNATDLMNKATELIQVMANQAEVTISVCSQDIEFHADCDRIIQVLTNLLSNAIKFSPRGSTVWLTVQQQSEEGECCSVCHDGNDSVESHPYCLLPHCWQPILFQVTDRGCGIPADKLESIFERFHQVDSSDSRRKGGTGLGLAICRSIIEQHGGQIWAESTLGKGSSFNFTLPGREEHHDHQANSSD